MNLKEHDIIMIKSDLQSGLFNDQFVTSKMLRYKGQLAIITGVVHYKDNDLYTLSVDDGKYWWTKDNFESGSYSKAMFAANELGLTYDELLSDFRNSTNKDPDEEIDSAELEKYVSNKYGKFL